MESSFRHLQVALATLVVTFLALNDARAQEHEYQPRRAISVNGTGTVTVQPDEMLISLTISRESDDYYSAVQAHDLTYDEISEMLTETGIDATLNVRTTLSVYSNERYNDYDGTYMGVMISAQSMVEIVLKDFDRYPELLAQVSQIEGVTAERPRYRATNMMEKRKEAIAMAVQECRQVAETIARSLGTTLGKPASVSESTMASTSYSAGYGAYASPYSHDGEASMGYYPTGMTSYESPITIASTVYMEFELP